MKITLTEVLTIVKNDEERRYLKRRVNDLLHERTELQALILELTANDAKLSASITAAFNKSETTETKMRAGLPAQPAAA